MLDIIKDIRVFLDKNRSIKYGVYVTFSSIVIAVIVGAYLTFVNDSLGTSGLYGGTPYLSGFLLELNSTVVLISTCVAWISSTNFALGISSAACLSFLEKETTKTL